MDIVRPKVHVIQSNMYMLTLKGNLETKLPFNGDVFGQWEEAGESIILQENSRQRDPGWDFNPGPLRCNNADNGSTVPS